MESFQVGFGAVLVSAASVLACGGYPNQGTQNTNLQPRTGTGGFISFRGPPATGGFPQPQSGGFAGPNGNGNGGPGFRRRRNVDDSPTKDVLSDTIKTSTKAERRDGHSNTDRDEQKHRPSPEKTSQRKPHEDGGSKGMPKPELNGDENRHDGKKSSWGKKDSQGNDRSEQTVTDKKDELKNLVISRTKRSLSDLKNMKEEKSKKCDETKEKEQYKEDKSDKITESKSQVVKDSEKHDTSKSCTEKKSVEEIRHEDFPKEGCKKDDESCECKKDDCTCCDCEECCCCKKKREQHDESSCSDRKYKKCD